MIVQLNVLHRNIAMQIVDIQKASYLVEAKLINYFDIPPLKETEKELQACGETFLGYVENEQLLGFLSYKRNNDILDIHRVAVHPNFFKQGIASSLLDALGDLGSITKIIVTTGTNNLPAIQLYEKKGFKRVETFTVAQNLSMTLLEKHMIN